MNSDLRSTQFTIRDLLVVTTVVAIMLSAAMSSWHYIVFAVCVCWAIMSFYLKRTRSTVILPCGNAVKRVAFHIYGTICGTVIGICIGLVSGYSAYLCLGRVPGSFFLFASVGGCVGFGLGLRWPNAMSAILHAIVFFLPV